MKKIFIMILLLLLTSGCLTDPAEIPQECSEYKDDVCALFDCMVDRCWCDDSSPELPVLYESPGTAITNEEEAKNIVMQYLNENNLEYQIENSVKLNNVFYNVFASDENGDEIVYTVAADGTIIKTFCGV